MTLEDHVIKVPGDVTEENSSLHILTLSKLIGVCHRHCVNGYVIILVYHVILQDQVIKSTCDYG